MARNWQQWSREELDTLVEEWPKGGWRHCKSVFPDRSFISVSGKANVLGLRISSRNLHRAQELTPWIEEQIREEYTTGQPNVRALASRVDRTRGWVTYQARVMGVARMAAGAPNQTWLEEEKALLEAGLNAGYTIVQIHNRFKKAGFKRSITAILARISHQKMSIRREHYTANDVAALFGVSCSKSIVDWINKGLLKAKKVSGASALEKTDALWHITPQAIKTFMLTHPARWNHRIMRKEVILDLLCGGRDGLNFLGRDHD